MRVTAIFPLLNIIELVDANGKISYMKVTEARNYKRGDEV